MYYRLRVKERTYLINYQTFKNFSVLTKIKLCKFYALKKKKDKKLRGENREKEKKRKRMNGMEKNSGKR